MKRFNKESENKKAIIYTKVSTDDQATTGFSLPQQEDSLRRECIRRGIQIVEHFQDDGYSGTNFKRPGFQRLLDYLKRHKNQIHHIFVTKWCRFSRDLENTILMSRELRGLGTSVLSLEDGKDCDTASGLLLKFFNMALPQIDNCTRASNTKSGIRRALKEGYYPYGAAPKGYSKDRNNPKTPLLIPNQEAPLVREAFEVFETNIFAIEDVRKAVWKNGLKLKRTQFGIMLRNPVYVGKTLVPEAKNEEACLVNGLHEAIVSEKTFWNVQKILDKRNENHSHLSTKEKLRDDSMFQFLKNTNLQLF